MINDLKDLKKILILCRAQGVTEITLGNDTIKFGDKPQRRARGRDISDEPQLPQSMDELIMQQLDLEQ